MTEPKDRLVLVTGGSGFLAAWCIIKLLDAGYRVRTTVRSLKRENDVREMLKTGGATKLDNVTFVAADLLNDDGWKDAVAGCTYVLHVASPFPAGLPKDENDLIIPAKEGTLRVLRVARDASVKRVVVTSSWAAIGQGNLPSDHVHDEKDWTEINHELYPYPKSKTLAERAAWDFIEKEGGSLELSVVNPVAIFGPALSSNYSTSIMVVARLLKGDIPGCPQLCTGIVDVRDAADLHLLAMTSLKASGERFLAVAPPEMSIAEVSKILHERLPELSKKAPTRELPNFVMRIVALWDPAVKMMVPNLGKRKKVTNEKAKTLLGWQPRSAADAIQATAESLVNLGVVKG
jgi:nucleoside-diphosphate-sugar epimerase